MQQPGTGTEGNSESFIRYRTRSIDEVLLVHLSSPAGLTSLDDPPLRIGVSRLTTHRLQGIAIHGFQDVRWLMPPRAAPAPRYWLDGRNRRPPTV